MQCGDVNISAYCLGNGKWMPLSILWRFRGWAEIMERGVMTSHWILPSGTYQGGEDQGNPSFISTRARPILFLRTSSQSQTTQQQWEKAQARATSLGIQAPTRYPCEFPLSGKKWERRDKMFWIYSGFNFFLGRKFSLADAKDLILLNYAEHCIGHCNYFMHIVKSNM